MRFVVKTAHGLRRGIQFTGHQVLEEVGFHHRGNKVWGDQGWITTFFEEWCPEELWGPRQWLACLRVSALDAQALSPVVRVEGCAPGEVGHGVIDCLVGSIVSVTKEEQDPQDAKTIFAARIAQLFHDDECTDGVTFDKVQPEGAGDEEMEVEVAWVGLRHEGNREFLYRKPSISIWVRHMPSLKCKQLPVNRKVGMELVKGSHLHGCHQTLTNVENLWSCDFSYRIVQNSQ
jgi:hypothetical protein